MPAAEMFLSTFLVRKGKAVVGLCETINNANLNCSFGLYSVKSCSSGFSGASTWFSLMSKCLCQSFNLIQTNNNFVYCNTNFKLLKKA